MNKPILFLDVDGPLNPFAAGSKKPEGYEKHMIIPPGWSKAIPVWLNPAHGPLLLEFSEKTGAELMWATTWEDGANKSIGPRIGLPELPVVHFGIYLRVDDWKWKSVARVADNRPFVWLDDDFSANPEMRPAFDTQRKGIPTLLHEISPQKGMLTTDLEVIESWMTRHIH